MSSIERRAAQALTFQEYGPQTPIEGVRVVRLNKHRAGEGWFLEHLRLDGGRVTGLDVSFEVRQLSFSYAAAHRLNAFHLHPKRTQDELWCVAVGLLRVWLVDVRDGSPTAGVKNQFILSGEEPSLLYIPSGVAHGYRAGHEGAFLVYAMTDQFNPEDSNEGRLPWDFFGSEIWEDNRG